MNIPEKARDLSNRYQSQNVLYKKSPGINQNKLNESQSSLRQNSPNAPKTKPFVTSKPLSKINNEKIKTQETSKDPVMFEEHYPRIIDGSKKTIAQVSFKSDKPISTLQSKIKLIDDPAWFVVAANANKISVSKNPKLSSPQQNPKDTAASKPTELNQTSGQSQIGNARAHSAKPTRKPFLPPSNSATKNFSVISNKIEATTTARNQGVKKNERPLTANDSRITSKLKTKPPLDPEEPIDYNPDECQICLIALFGKKKARTRPEIAILDGCGHLFHKPCLIPYLTDAIRNWKFPIQCPHARCKKEILSTNLKEILPIKTYEKFEEASLKFYLRQLNDRVARCYTSNCPYAVELDRANQILVLKCPLCRGSYCLKCEKPSHEGLTCDEKKGMQNEDPVVVEFVKGKQMRRCTTCKFWIEKIEGCNHMTCRCKNEFCYLCGVKWKQCGC